MNRSTQRPKKKPLNKPKKVSKLSLPPIPEAPRPPEYDHDLLAEKTIYDFEIVTKLKKIAAKVEDVC